MLDDTRNYHPSPEQKLAQCALIRAILDANDIGVPSNEKYEVDYSDRFLRETPPRFWELCSLAGWDGEWLRDAYVSGKIDAYRLKHLEIGEAVTEGKLSGPRSGDARRRYIHDQRAKRRQRVLDVVRANPGILTMDVGKRVSGTHPKTVATILRAFRAKGILTAKKVGDPRGGAALSWRLADQ